MGSLTLGLDLGQAQDYSALVVVEQNGTRYDVGHIQRWALGTTYPVIVADVKALLAQLARYDPTLVIDATGVGRPVTDMFRAAAVECVPVLITGGMTASVDELGFQHVPKRELVATVQVLLQGQRLKIAKALPDAVTLSQELLNFRAKITASANDVYGEWRQGAHDDLVLALALALWYAEREGGPWTWGMEDD